MELTINSKKHGKRIVFINDEDYGLIKAHKWRLLKQPLKEYAITNIKKGGKICTLRMHILIMGKRKGKEIDHKNGNGLDNRRVNLRFLTHRQNMHNMKPFKTNTTGYRGVSLDSNGKGNYASYIHVNNKKIYLGNFKDKKDAAKAYNIAARKYHGKYAFQNKI
jgi:hypothetical protein